MRRLSSQRAIEAWEKGQGVDSQELPLALLSVALPDEDRARLARLTLGQRDALLMRLRERTFGREITGFAQCPKCAARLQFALDLAAYDVAGTLERRIGPQELEWEGWRVRFRLPESNDLLAASRCPDVDSARTVLLVRCVLAAEHDGRAVSPPALPDELVEHLGARMEEADPLAYLPLAIDCARCGHDWVVLFDAGRILWQEIASTAERLLYEVQALAMAYGWSESEILSMSAARRRFYMQRAPESEAPAPRRRRG